LPMLGVIAAVLAVLVGVRRMMRKRRTERCL
jgi:flagellar biogenesis protein FliO